jgi:hypothetical protein
MTLSYSFKKVVNLFMSLKEKKVTSKKKATKKAVAVLSDNVGNYEKHPFFIKKVAAAKALLQEVGLPKQLTRSKAHA